MHVNLIFGFLGSGKTTLLRRVLAQGQAAEPLAVIVNEFGEVGIDGTILSGRNVDMVELTSGCLCCTLKGSLLNAVEELRDRGAARTIIEATGVAQPEEMIETFADPAVRSSLRIGPFVTVIDAPKFNALREMLGDFYSDQVANADVLLLNKIDRAGAAQLEAVRSEVAKLNPGAAILFTKQCDAELGLLLEGDSRVLAAHEGHDHHHEHGPAPFDSFVTEASAASPRAALEAFFASLPASVLRAKGHMTVDGRPCLVQYAAGQLEITDAEAEHRPQLVFIGRPLDRAAIEADLAGLGAGEPSATEAARR